MTELFKLTCFKCGEVVELPTVLRKCPHCQVEFDIAWSVERQEYESKGDTEGGRNLAERKRRDREPATYE